MSIARLRGWALVAALMAAMFNAPAQAALVFVGTFQVGDGPLWTTNPLCYSAREAAALLFGGVFTDYAISTNSNTVDPNTVNHLAFVDGWANTQFLLNPTSEDFKLQTGTGYNDPFGGPAYSAYVHDHDAGGGPYLPGNNTGLYVNYVWRNQAAAAVPEPASLAMFGAAGLAFGAVLMRRRRSATT